MWDAYSDALWDLSDSRLTIVFDGVGMRTRYINTVMPQDISLAVFSFVFVWVYMAFMSKSWFRATMGMGQVLLCMCPSYMIYFLVLQQRYAGVFHALSVFLLLGIGADDICERHAPTRTRRPAPT